MNRIRNEDSSLQFTRKVLITVGTTIPIVLLLLVSGYVAQMLVLIFAGILLAILLRGLAGLLRRLTGLSNGWSVGVVLLLSKVSSRIQAKLRVRSERQFSNGEDLCQLTIRAIDRATGENPLLP